MSSNELKFLLITNSEEVCHFAIQAGVDQIFIDLEQNGKLERQGHRDTVISRHCISDIEKLRRIVPAGRLLVRINPLSNDSSEEIEQVINSGADVLMLPMFRTVQEVSDFARIVDGRAKCCLLVETVGAVSCLDHCLRVPGIDRVHIGLNDLHMELKLDFMLELFANGWLEKICKILNKAGIEFGIGGLAKCGAGLLPAESLISEHIRLGSRWAILSRSFHGNAKSVSEINEQMNFKYELEKLRDKYQHFQLQSPQMIVETHINNCKKIFQIKKSIRLSKGLVV